MIKEARTIGLWQRIKFKLSVTPEEWNTLYASREFLKNHLKLVLAIGEEHYAIQLRHISALDKKIAELNSIIEEQRRVILAIREDNEKLHKFKDKYGEGMGFMHPSLREINETI